MHYEKHSDIGQAKPRQRQLKGWRREKKIALIEKMARAGRTRLSKGKNMLFPGQPLKRTL